MNDEDINFLTEHLCSIGCNESEIRRIVEQVCEYDRQTVHQSVFDSIASGSFNVNALIKEVRATEDGPTHLVAAEPE